MNALSEIWTWLLRKKSSISLDYLANFIFHDHIYRIPIASISLVHFHVTNRVISYEKSKCFGSLTSTILSRNNHSSPDLISPIIFLQTFVSRKWVFILFPMKMCLKKESIRHTLRWRKNSIQNLLSNVSARMDLMTLFRIKSIRRPQKSRESSDSHNFTTNITSTSTISNNVRCCPTDRFAEA